MRSTSVLLFLVAIALTLAGCGRLAEVSAATKGDSNGEYHAVFLDSGAVFFGHLQNAESAHPVLTDVFYVESTTDPQTKQVSNVLVKRGREWHAPTSMTISAEHILFTEPVSSGSQVANLIQQANAGGK